MKIKSTTRIGSMILTFPQLEDVFELHDVEIDDEVISMSVKGVCRAFGLDIDEVLGDLRAALSDSAGEGWLVGEDDDFEEEDDESYSEDESSYDEEAEEPEEEDYDLDEDLDGEEDDYMD